MTWTDWVPSLTAAFLLFVGRNWIRAWIEKDIQFRFDEKVEAVKNEMRMKEAAFASELRSRETEISALRDGVLSGRLNRQSLVDGRRIDAVVRVWTAISELAPFMAVAASMAVINFDAAAKEAAHNPQVRKLFEIMGKNVPEGHKLTRTAWNERPFLTPIAWAYFSAYQTIVIAAYTSLKLLELGVAGEREFIKTDAIKKLLKAALPHHEKFIDSQDTSAYYYLLNELEENLLAELKNILDGVDIDNATIARSAKIMVEVNNVSKGLEPEASRAGL